MTTRSPARRAGIFLAFALAFPVLLMGCPKKSPPGVDAGEPAPPASSTSVAELAPLTDDLGDGGTEAEAGPKKWTGPGTSPNQAKIQACCRAMRTEAITLGPGSPEAFQLNAIAGQCDVFARQIGPAGNAPELNQLRQVLRSVRLPAACQF
jgi:hypothetical protein